MHIPLHSFQIPAYHKATKKSTKFCSITHASKALFIKVCNTWLRYETCMFNSKTPIANLKSGFVVSKSYPVLGASPDAKVVFWCSLSFGQNALTQYSMWHSWRQALTPPFSWKVSDTECKLKTDHPYYAQVQGQLEPSGVISLCILERGFTFREYQLMQPIGRTFSINSWNIFLNFAAADFQTSVENHLVGNKHFLKMLRFNSVPGVKMHYF